jgi:hypothetical protein
MIKTKNLIKNINFSTVNLRANTSIVNATNNNNTTLKKNRRISQ